MIPSSQNRPEYKEKLKGRERNEFYMKYLKLVFPNISKKLSIKNKETKKQTYHKLLFKKKKSAFK